MTPETPESLYSTRLRTAVVLTGSGTAGAYHAGVLRALHEAGVRIDLVAGRGIGAAGAVFAAVDGGARLWEPGGVWKGDPARRFYPWRPAVRMAGWALAAAVLVLLFPILLLACAIVVGVAGLLLTLAGLEAAGAAITTGFTRYLATLFEPGVLPTIVPRLVLLATLVAAAALAGGWVSDRVRARVRRRAGRGSIWQLLGSPITARPVLETFTTELWKLLRGAASVGRPPAGDLARRYAELLSENLGQPGFRELLVLVHDLDARQDLVFAFLAERHRQRFFAAASGAPAARGAEAFDLSGIGREHALDMLAAALAIPFATEPHLVTFPADGPWRGEVHRGCDRPGALGRLLAEVAAAGAEQVILVTAAPRPARPHELRSRPVDLRGRAGDELAAFEAAGLRDGVGEFAGRFAGLHVIRPDHNPVGALDFAGVHDERSDRRFTVAELVDRGYEDAYRQFIDPAVGAGGERIESRSLEPRGAVPGAIEL